MKKALLAATLAVLAGFAVNARVSAQEAPRYGTEVCVNAKLADEAKRLFPNATLHVLPDLPYGMNGWRIVSGNVRADGKIHTDAEEIYARQLDAHRGVLWGE